jgi:hypothetical protein
MAGKSNILTEGKKMIPSRDQPSVDTGTPLDDDRRRFLASCGKFAVVTPPAITMLLSTSLNSTAIARSGGDGHSGGRGNNGHRNGGEDGSRNGREDHDRHDR